MVRKLHLRESDNDYSRQVLARTRQRLANKQHIMDVYGIDDTAFDLYKIAELNTDIIHADNPAKAEIGYKAYYDLTKYLEEAGLPDDILYDLAADFEWSDKLDNAFRRYDRAYR